MRDLQSRRWLDGVLFAGIGLLEGTVWWAVVRVPDPGRARLALVSLFFVSSAALALRLIWSARKPLRACALGLFLGALVAAVAGWVMVQVPARGAAYRGDELRIATWIVGAFVLLYVAMPFAQIFQESGQLRFPYVRLFDHSWNNFFVGAVALLFVGVLWAILGLWAGLFHLIGIAWFEDLFTSPAFAFLATFTAFGWGLDIGRASEGVIRTLRRIALLIGRTVLPLLAAIALLFLAALPITGLEPLWKTGRATFLLLALLAALGLSLNAVFEDGRGRPPYVRLVRGTVGAAVLAMPVLAGLAFYATGLRVAQHGLTPERVFALLFDVVAAAYAAGYAAAVLVPRSAWLGLLPQVNVALAVFVAALAVLVHTPLLDPLRLSTAEQTWRLGSGRVDPAEFDYAALRFQLGHAGFAALERLETIRDHPQADAIRRFAKRAANASDYDEARRASGPPSALPLFRVIPDGTPVPGDLASAIKSDRSRPSRPCGVSASCLLVAVDLDEDGRLEYCVLSPGPFPDPGCYGSDASGGWRWIGKLVYRGDGPTPRLAEIEKRLGRGPLRTKAPPYRALDLGAGELEVVP